MTKSTNKVEVVPINLHPHPNADSLSVMHIFGYTVVCNTEAWKDKKIAAWIPPDSLVDTQLNEFSFLNDGKATMYYVDGLSSKQKTPQADDMPIYARIRMKKLRSVISYGLLVEAPKNSNIGDDVANQLGVKHWNPPEPVSSAGEVASGPNIYSPKYDVDSFQRYAKEVFVHQEPCVITEKIHGCNGRWVYLNGEFHCGSRTEWKKEFPTAPNIKKIVDDMMDAGSPPEKILEVGDKLLAYKPSQNLWWKALKSNPELMDWLKSNPGVVVYGEVYGQVQDLKYGTKPGEVKIAVFDLLSESKWVDFKAARLSAPHLPWVPVLEEEMAFDFNKLIAMAERKSLIKGAENQISEGIVVKPIHERTHDAIGRVQLKIVSVAYLERK